MEQPNEEQLLVSAIQYFMDGGEEQIANVLLACTLSLIGDCGGWAGNNYVYGFQVQLTGPRWAFEELRDPVSSLADSIKDALEALLPSDCYLTGVVPRVALTPVSADWRTELLEIVRGEGITNQALSDQTARIITWNNLRFRSESERLIAAALDQVGSLYFANCRARVGPPVARRNREPDFLICADGKWGILEVDGDPFHPPSRTAEDHERDRLFKAHGIRVIEHFTATECYATQIKSLRRFSPFSSRLRTTLPADANTPNQTAPNCRWYGGASSHPVASPKATRLRYCSKVGEKRLHDLIRLLVTANGIKSRNDHNASSA
jgi:hypothetical protein